MSDLFRLASEAARRTALIVFSRTPFGRAARDIRAATRERWWESGFRRAANQSDRESILQTAQREFDRAVDRYSLSTQTRQAMGKIFQSMGPLGKIFQALLNGSSNFRNLPDDQIRAAAELIRAFGGEVFAPPGHPDHQRGVEAARRLLGRDWVDETPNASTGSIGTAGIDQEAELSPVPSLSPEIRTPKSSNVWSFRYDYRTSTLYVRFRASAYNPKEISFGAGRGQLPHVRGTLGRTVQGKLDAPGPMYAYSSVPVRVFERLAKADSAGKAVWDELRIRGTVWGHQYAYRLVHGDVVTRGDSVGWYIPRKATARGFVARSQVASGTGRRDFARSSLPSQALDLRGRPQRGRPNTIIRGRP